MNFCPPHQFSNMRTKSKMLQFGIQVQNNSVGKICKSDANTLLNSKNCNLRRRFRSHFSSRPSKAPSMHTYDKVAASADTEVFLPRYEAHISAIWQFAVTWRWFRKTSMCSSRIYIAATQCERKHYAHRLYAARIA